MADVNQRVVAYLATDRADTCDSVAYARWMHGWSVGKVVAAVLGAVVALAVLGRWVIERILIALGVEAGSYWLEFVSLAVVTVIGALLATWVISRQPGGYVAARFGDEVAIVTLSPWHKRPLAVEWFAIPVPLTVNHVRVGATQIVIGSHRMYFPLRGDFTRFVEVLGHADSPNVSYDRMPT